MENDLSDKILISINLIQYYSRTSGEYLESIIYR